MASIAVHEFIALDGVFESPSWTAEFGFDPAMGETLGAITGRAGAILLGRKTFEMFAPAWRDRAEADDPGAPFFNQTRKYVVGTDVPTDEWNNSTSLGPYDPDVIRRLKEEQDRDIYVSGSGQLVRAMLAEGLVDELHLFVYPIALGEGDRLWSAGEGPTRMRLTAHDVYDNGVVHLCYGPAAG